MSDFLKFNDALYKIQEIANLGIKVYTQRIPDYLRGSSEAVLDISLNLTYISHRYLRGNIATRVFTFISFFEA